MHTGTQDGLFGHGRTMMSWALATMIVLAVTFGLMDMAAAMAGAGV
jgi:hypothetical protein